MYTDPNEEKAKATEEQQTPDTQTPDANAQAIPEPEKEGAGALVD